MHILQSIQEAKITSCVARGQLAFIVRKLSLVNIVYKRRVGIVQGLQTINFIPHLFSEVEDIYA